MDISSTPSKFLFIPTICLCIFSLTAQAEPQLPDLKKGMESVEVLKLWGKPAGRIEREVKRSETWEYPQGAEVKLVESRVVSWKFAQERAIEPSQPKVQAPDDQRIATHLDTDTRDLVREIASEVPSSPDAPFVESSDPAASTNSITNSVPPIPQANVLSNGQINQQQVIEDE